MDVPAELATLPQWVGWKYERRKNKTTKAPYRALDGKRASSTDPDDWCTLEEALAGAETNGLNGIGFVFSENDPYCGVDLDDCRDPRTGVIHDEAQTLIDYLASYTEVSPSGTGVHAIVKAAMSGPGRRMKDTPWGGHLECYDKGRYFTWTGDTLGSVQIRESKLELGLLSNPVTKERSGSWLKDARQNPLFVDLYDEGDITDYESPSSADFALMNLLIESIGYKPLQLFQAFASSALYRGDEKSGGDQYVLRTIENAFGEESVTPERKKERLSREVAKEVHRYEVREEAQKEWLKRQNPEGLFLPDSTLADELLLPDLDEMYRIQGLHPLGGNVVLVASYKSGKTTLTHNLIKSLADGTPFLGKYEMSPLEGGICVMNYEERPEQWRRHARKLEVENADRVFPIHRRGLPILPVWDKELRQELVKWMIEREITYWILDPMAVAWQGLVDNENDNALAAAFTTALDQVKQEAGISELLISHHTGRQEGADTRGRGATRVEDWADALWYLERDNKPPHPRTMHARGRDVEVDRFLLKFDDFKFTAGQATTDDKDDAEAMSVVEILVEFQDDGQSVVSTSELSIKQKGTSTRKQERREAAVKRGWVKREGLHPVVWSVTQLGIRYWEKRQ